MRRFNRVKARCRGIAGSLSDSPAFADVNRVGSEKVRVDGRL